MDSQTDCRSEEGITYGLIDAIISIARIARHRDLSPFVIQEALADLRDDEDVAFLLGDNNG
jgi:hypothetical protein